MKILMGKYEGTIYPEDNGYIGAITLGYDGWGHRQRLKRGGRTKEIVKDRLKKAVAELEAGIETSDDYTVENAVRDWFARAPRACPPRQSTTTRASPSPTSSRSSARRSSRA